MMVNLELPTISRTKICGEIDHTMIIQGGPKKKRTGDILQNSQSIGPMNPKIGMHNLNTISFQYLKYEFPNFKAL